MRLNALGYAMVVTVEKACYLLHYPSIEQRYRGQSYDGVLYEVDCLCATPRQDVLDSVYIYLDENWEIVDCVAFAHWHGHFEGAADEEQNTRKAFQMARALVHRKRCIIEEYDANGRCLGSAAVAPRAVPDTLCRTTVRLRRVFFGLPPANEAIDFSRYFRGRHLWIEKSRKEESERFWRQ